MTLRQVWMAVHVTVFCLFTSGAFGWPSFIAAADIKYIYRQSSRDRNSENNPDAAHDCSDDFCCKCLLVRNDWHVVFWKIYQNQQW